MAKWKNGGSHFCEAESGVWTSYFFLIPLDSVRVPQFEKIETQYPTRTSWSPAFPT